MSLLRRFWNALPIDGAGLIAPGDADGRWLVRFARRRYPLGSVAVGRLAWCAKVFGWRHHMIRNLGAEAAWRAIGDACHYGLLPKESRMWRGPMKALPERPLSPIAFAKILSALGDPGQRALLTDKKATAELLAARGITVPETLAVIPKGAADVALPEDGVLFVKPRGGSRGRDAFRIEDRAAARERLNQVLAEHEVLVQRCLTAAPELADLATGGVPAVLRLVVAREPGGEPFLHSALFTVRVPGEHPNHVYRALLRMPVSGADGTLCAGYWLATPDRSYDRSPWHDAVIAGRPLPGFQAALAMALEATRAFDKLPNIGWDVVLSDKGPVILEGNSHNDWLLTTLIARDGMPDTPPLLSILRRWAVT